MAKGRRQQQQLARRPPLADTSAGISSLQVRREEWHIGPLPAPDILIRYNEAVPDAAERILRTAERQAEHRQSLEKKVISSDVVRSWAGLLAGLVVALAFLGVSAQLISTGHGLEGTILGTVDIGALVGVFVWGRLDQKAERVEKERIRRGET